MDLYCIQFLLDLDVHRQPRVATANGHVNGNNDRKPTDENGYPMFRETCISQGKYASYGLIEANSNSEPYTVYLCNYGMPSLPMCLYMYLCVIYIYKLYIIVLFVSLLAG